MADLDLNLLTACFGNGTICIDFGRLINNSTGVNLTNISIVLGRVANIFNEPANEQAPFTGFASQWLIGVVLSLVLILFIFIYTIIQARLREHMRKRRQQYSNEPGLVDPLDPIGQQFKNTEIVMSEPLRSSNAHVVKFALTESALKHEEVLSLSSLAAANPNNESLKIEFHELSLTLLNGHGRSVLKHVSGSLFPGSMTAILGPSGCGKTSFLTTIAGRASYGKMSGLVKVNGREQSIGKFRTVVGFVPQEDVMIRTLTVRQNLMFSAKMRLPREMSLKQKEEVVDAVLQVLGLENIQHQLIGDETLRGISGGQRKRVNIGIELVSAPLALFLDEPTSGLDSTSAVQAIGSLLALLPLKINIAAVVHQPREEIFNLFDRILLLSEGGRTVYSGKRSLMIPYFQQLGFRFDPNLNPADQVLDIICGKQRPMDMSANDHSFADLWESFSGRERAFDRMPSYDEQSFQTMDEVLRLRGNNSKAARAPLAPLTSTPLQDVMDHKNNAKSRWIKALLAIMTNLVGVVVCACFIGIEFTNHLTYIWVIIPFCSVALVMYVVTIALIIITAIKSKSRNRMEKFLFYSMGTVFGPLALVAFVIWQQYKRNRYYLYWLFVCAGFGVWTIILCAALGMELALRSTGYSTVYSFTTDVGTSWLLFVCAPLGLVVFGASVLRIVRRSTSSIRPIAPFLVQIWLQMRRCVTQLWRQPAGLLLDFLLAAITGILIGVTTSGRWKEPLLEQLARITSGTAIAVTNCPVFIPQLGCLLLSNPQSDPIFKSSLFISLALGLIGVISSLRFFGYDKANFQREHLASLSTTAVFLGKSIVAFFLSVIMSCIFLSFWGWFAQPAANAGVYFCFILVMLNVAISLGFLCSICLRLDYAGMIGILVVLICTLFSTALAGQGDFQSVVSYFSFVSWGSTTFYTTSVEPFNANLTPWMQNVYGISPSLMVFGWNQLVCLGLFMRLLAWFALVTKEM